MTRLAALLPLLLLAAGLAAVGGRRSSADGSGEPARVELSELRDRPAARLGEEVRLVVQLDRPLEAWNPWLTRFGTEDFAAWSVWGDDALLWERGDFEDRFERAFARRGSAAERALRHARPYWRYELVAVPREVFLGEPWLELLSARRLDEHVTEGTLLHAGRALDLLDEGRPSLALGEIERARAAPLPERAAGELARIEERIRLALGE